MDTLQEEIVAIIVRKGDEIYATVRSEHTEGDYDLPSLSRAGVKYFSASVAVAASCRSRKGRERIDFHGRSVG